MKQAMGFAAILLLLVSVSSVFANSLSPRARAVHASPDAPNVDIWVDGGLAFADLPFGAATDFAELPKGVYNFQVVPTGATSPVVIDADLRLVPRADYTIVAVNELAMIEPLVLRDWRSFVPNFQSMVRFVHASPDAPAVDIAVKEGPVIFSDVEFKETDKRRVRAGTYDLEVRVAGTDTVALELPGIELEGGTAYSVFAVGTLSEGTLTALLTEDRKTPHPVFG